MRDCSTFKLSDTLWHREWTGDAYHWTAGNLRVGWCDPVRVDDGHDADGEVITKFVRRYFLEVDGVRANVFFNTTKAAMLAAMRGDHNGR